ncbi:MAG: DUF421 domain-containing protein [Bacillota bacterium]|nr:DUF421 domain-containing protein [Bacillota bacterium]
MSFNQILNLISRTVLIFFVLLFLARFLGKKQLSQLTYFNYITGITIGSIAANIISRTNQPFLDEFIGLASWCLLTDLISVLSLKSSKVRTLLDGEPAIIIKKGLINYKTLKISRLNLDDVSMMLREQNVFSITDIDYAILEPDGKLSILKKPEVQLATKKDVKAELSSTAYLPSEIITDGKVVYKNLKELNLSENWLKNALSSQNVNSVDEVMYAEIQSDGTLYLQKYI